MVDSPPNMPRRRFMGSLAKAATAVMAAGWLPPTVKAALKPEHSSPDMHYRPLHGDNLRELARRKQHHGSNRFLNPMGIARDGRWAKLLSWKLLHPNRYSDFLGDQPLSPVTIDWEPFKAHRGVSVTFVKHATLMIKDVDRYLLIDAARQSLDHAQSPGRDRPLLVGRISDQNRGWSGHLCLRGQRLFRRIRTAGR